LLVHVEIKYLFPMSNKETLRNLSKFVYQILKIKIINKLINL